MTCCSSSMTAVALWRSCVRSDECFGAEPQELLLKCWHGACILPALIPNTVLEPLGAGSLTSCMSFANVQRSSLAASQALGVNR